MDTLENHERREVWRTIWGTATSSALLAVLAAIVFAVAAAVELLPQAPAVMDGAVLSQWRAVAQLRLGAWFAPFDAFGFYDVRGTPWLLLPAFALAAVALLRIAERFARLRVDDARETIADGRRLRVTDAVVDSDVMRAALHQRRYRTRVDGEVLLATRAPIAEAASLVMHVGLLVIVLALLLNVYIGWDVVGVRAVSDGTKASLHDGYAVMLAQDSDQPDVVTLRFESGDVVKASVGGSMLVARDVRVTLRNLSAGYTVSAKDADGRTLAIRTSNYLSPTEKAAVDFGGEDSVTIAVPDAKLVVSLLHAPGGGADQLRAYSVGAAQKVIFAPIEPFMAIGDARLNIEPMLSIELDASRRPGTAATILGAALALLGLLGGLRWPMRRIAVRRVGPWTEYFADGRGVRADVVAVTQR